MVFQCVYLHPSKIICIQFFYNHTGMVLALSKGPEHPKNIVWFCWVFFLFFFEKQEITVFMFFGEFK